MTRLVLLPNGERINPDRVTRVRKASDWNIVVHLAGQDQSFIHVVAASTRTPESQKAECQRVFDEVCRAIENPSETVPIAQVPSPPVAVSQSTVTQDSSDSSTEFYNFCLYYFACKVCSATPDESGDVRHGRGCFTQSGDGGGDNWVDLEVECQEIVKRKFPNARCFIDRDAYILEKSGGFIIASSPKSETQAWINAAISIWKKEKESEARNNVPV